MDLLYYYPEEILLIVFSMLPFFKDVFLYNVLAFFQSLKKLTRSYFIVPNEISRYLNK